MTLEEYCKAHRTRPTRGLIKDKNDKIIDFFGVYDLYVFNHDIWDYKVVNYLRQSKFAIVRRV